MIVYALSTTFLILLIVHLYKYVTTFKKIITIKFKHGLTDKNGTSSYVHDNKNVVYKLDTHLSLAEIIYEQEYYIEGYGVYSKIFKLYPIIDNFCLHK